MADLYRGMPHADPALWWTTVPEPGQREPEAVYIEGLHDRAVYEAAAAVYVSGVRFERPRRCRLELVDRGRPDNTYRCTCCGKLHTASRAQRFCPRCGAQNEEPDRHDSNTMAHTRASGNGMAAKGGKSGKLSGKRKTGPLHRKDTAITRNLERLGSDGHGHSDG